MRRSDTERAAFKRAVDPEPCCMPGVRGPVKKRDKEENDRHAIALAKQAMTEFAALVIEEQEITGRRDDEDRPPHGAEGGQEVAGP